MARYRLSRFAEADLARILSTSEKRWGLEARRRYSAMLVAAMRNLAADPEGPGTRERSELAPGIRSFHLRRARVDDPKTKVRRPMHVLYYRALAPNLIEIVRVLHERMEPSRHAGTAAEDET
jgi:toxin ParE1/3/4